MSDQVIQILWWRLHVWWFINCRMKSIEASDMKPMMDTESAYIDPLRRKNSVRALLRSWTWRARLTTEIPMALLWRRGLFKVVWCRWYVFCWSWSGIFLFDDVRFSNSMNKVSFRSTLWCIWNTDTEYEIGNTGHRLYVKGGYFPVNPIDDGQDIRSEMLSNNEVVGNVVDKHHHSSILSHELG